ncbi:MAG: hypothetical protein Q9226_003294 [Calogaya cf. arnoldii]
MNFQWQQLDLEKERFEIDLRRRLAHAMTPGYWSVEFPRASTSQQQRGESERPPSRQQRNLGGQAGHIRDRQATPSRGRQQTPSRGRRVSLRRGQAPSAPVQRSGPREPKIEKQVSQIQSRQANERRQDQVRRGLQALSEQPPQPQQLKAEDLGVRGSIKEEPREATPDPPIKKEPGTGSGDELE